MPKKPRSPGGRPGRGAVLLVDDVEDNREIYAQHLRFEGYEVLEASNGVDALAVADRAQPAVIVLDLSMPGLDGWEVCRRLRANARTRNIFVIAVTGHAFPDARERALDAGVDVYFTKPCLPESLTAAIERLTLRE